MDPLSDVLALLKPQAYMFRGLEVAGPWCLAFPPVVGIGCYAVLSGQCEVAVDGEPAPLIVAAGECVLLTRSQAFRMGSDTGLAPIDAVALLSTAPEGGVATWNGGGDMTGIGGYFSFHGPQAKAVLALLPPIVHVRQQASRAALLGAMELMLRELREPQPGGAVMARHLSQLMLVLALRHWLADDSRPGPGWLRALADRQVGAAIHAMHADPGRAWTLDALAALAHMSRSTFALRFRQTVGTPPLEYLGRWRMMLAAERLASSDASVARVAEALGYESGSAFSTAFRRFMGCSPRSYVSALEQSSRSTPEAPARGGASRRQSA